MAYDFGGYVTRNNLRCTDGRVIMSNAFQDNNGKNVPLVWNHDHNDPSNVLGNVTLEHREDGVYGYGSFNETSRALDAKKCLLHGDIVSLSICANRLKQDGNCVVHGDIKEVSLVLAGANPGAYIDNLMIHGEASDDEAIISMDQPLDLTEELVHSEEGNAVEEPSPEATGFEQEESQLEHSDDDETVSDVFNTLNEKQKKAVMAYVTIAIETGGKVDNIMEHADNSENTNDETIGEIFATLTEKQKNAALHMIANALEINHSEEIEGGNEQMANHNVFDQEEMERNDVLTHADQLNIINMAKASGCGSLRTALATFVEQNETLQHGFDEESIETLFPDYRFLNPGEPEKIPRETGWVDEVIKMVSKSPFSRIRTRQADVSALRSKGYKTKGEKKTNMENITLVGRTTDPQTVYVHDELHRDDIIDITDFDIVAYQYGCMKDALAEEVAQAILIGDGREPGSPDKIDETHIRPIWTDDDLYTIHVDVDFEKAKADLQGTNTAAQFGSDYIFTEAIISASLFAREKYKGSGNLSFWCTPHTVNRMLLARDLTGRRIYNSIAEITSALNVRKIHTVEAFEGKTRTTKDVGPKTKKLLGLFVNLADYNVGAVKKGEIGKFEDFDIDFNKYKYLMETRLSGALTRVYSAIALEEDVTEVV